jgi:hypothetical protein
MDYAAGVDIPLFIRRTKLLLDGKQHCVGRARRVSVGAGVALVWRPVMDAVYERLSNCRALPVRAF